MAIIAYTGIEAGSFAECIATNGTISANSTIKHTGGYSARCNPSESTGYFIISYSTAGRRLSAYCYIDTSPDAETLLVGTNGSNNVNVRLTTDRYLKLYNNDTQKGSTGTTQLNEDTWYRISISLDSDSANDPCKVYIDGNEEISANTDGGAQILLRFGCQTFPVSADIYMDDCIADDTPSTDDLGDIRVQLAQPNANGDLNDFDGNTGGETYHYEYYDDPPGGLDDNDYVIHEAKTQVQDIANLESCTEAGLAGTDTIKAVEILYRWKLSKDGNDLPDVYVKDNGTGYATVVPRDSDDVWYWDLKVYPLMPDDNGAWSQARFNAFQAGMQSSGAAPDVYLSCVMVMIAYTPTVAGQTITLTAAISVSATVQAPTVARTNQYIIPSPVTVATSVQAPTVAGTGSVPITIAAGIQTVASVQAPSIAGSGSASIVVSSQMYEEYNDGSLDIRGSFFTTSWRGQTFTPSTTHYITSVRLRLSRKGDPPDFTVAIRATSGGEPTGSNLISGTFSPEPITTDAAGDWYEITFDDSLLVLSGVMMAIICYSAGGDSNNCVYVTADSTSPAYAGGTYLSSATSGSSWSIHTTIDTIFEEWGRYIPYTVATVQAPTVARTNQYALPYALFENFITGDETSMGCYIGYYRGQTFTPDKSHGIRSVKLKLFKTGSPGDFVIAIYATSDEKPTGAALASITVDPAGITTNPAGTWYEYLFPINPQLSLDIMYAIVIECDGANSSNQISWRVDQQAGYSGGIAVYSTSQGSSWTKNAPNDFVFEEHGYAAISVVASVQAPTVAGSGSAPVTPSPVQVTATVQAPTVARTNQYIIPSPVQVVASVQAPSVSTPFPQTITLTAAIAVSATVQAPAVLGSGSVPITVTPISVATSVQDPTVARTNQYVILSPVQVVASVQSPSVAATGSAPVTLTAGISVTATVQSPSVAGTGSAPITLTPISVVRSVQAPSVIKTGQYILLSPVSMVATVQAPTVAGSGSAPVTVTPISVIATVQAPTVSTPSGDQYITLTAAISVATSVITPSVSGSGSVGITLIPIAVVSSVQSPIVGATGSAPIGILPIAVIASVQSPTVAGTGSAAITLLPISVITSIVSPTVSITGDQVITLLSAIATSATVVSPRIRLTAFILINAFLGNRVASAYITELTIKGYIDERDFDTCIGDRSIDAYISDRGFDTSKRTKP